MDKKPVYVIYKNIQFDFLELIDVQAIIDTCTDEWFNQSLCRVNDCVVRMGIFKKGSFHFHKHEAEDEFFYVLEGELSIDFHDESVVLSKNQGIVVPKGIIHRPTVIKSSVVLMIEGSTVKPMGD